MNKIIQRKINKPLMLLSFLFSLPAGAEDIQINNSVNLFSNMINDSHADLSFRNVFKNLSTQDYGQRSNQTAWGQGITLV